MRTGGGGSIRCLERICSLSQFIAVSRSQGIATVTINRPDRHNALHPTAHYELESCLDALAADESVRVVILTGAGDKAFCAGYDLRDNLETGVMDIPSTGFGGLTFRTDFPHPLIAAVNGVAMGGGFEMALACDLLLASTSARFALPEPKVGWMALGGGIQRLPRDIGSKRAMGMILTGRTVDAAEGLSLGFVNEVLAPDALMARAQALAEEITACAPLAVRYSKRAFYDSLAQADLARALDPATYPYAMTVIESEDGVEGKRAFAERRAPVWTGR